MSFINDYLYSRAMRTNPQFAQMEQARMQAEQAAQMQAAQQQQIQSLWGEYAGQQAMPEQVEQTQYQMSPDEMMEGEAPIQGLFDEEITPAQAASGIYSQDPAERQQAILALSYLAPEEHMKQFSGHSAGLFENVAPVKPSAYAEKLEHFRQNPEEFAAVQGALNPADTISVDARNVGTDPFLEKAGEKQATAFTELSTTGRNARVKAAQVGELRDALSQSGSGLGTALQAFAADYGIEIGEGVPQAQQAQAIINQIVPAQRPPGSGQMSDADLALFKSSVPRLINTPGGNALIMDTMQAVAEYEVEIGNIADQALLGNITRNEAIQQMNALGNPIKEFKARKKALEKGEDNGAPASPTAPVGPTLDPSVQDLVNQYGG